MFNHGKDLLFGQVVKIMEEMATQDTTLAFQAHMAEKELKRVQAQLADARQAQRGGRRNKLNDKPEEAIISGLKAKLAEAKKKEVNPGEFRKVLINKFLQS